MFNTIKKIAMGASVVASVSVLGTPAFAGTLTGVSTSGDVRVFQEIGGGQVQLSGSNDNATIMEALGNTGNVELDDNIDYGWANETPSTLTANFTDGSITFGSVGQADWLGGLGTTWTNGIYSAYSSQFNSLGITSANALLWSINNNPLLSTKNVFQRLSDPNIQSVTSNNGEYSFELAGHNTFASGLQLNVADPLYPVLSQMMASEVVKYSLDGGTKWNYAYSFGTPGSAGEFDQGSYQSGVVDAGDGFSFTRNFKFKVGEPAAKVPEPSTLLGLAAIGGLVAASKHRKNA
ncbi:NF038130 family PEP-CTERM protein [Roseofilum sp. Belize Diploria]|uniref:NF038130 family PEP-CTERM protein n=2 Tax=unclassified Roseofilum TaxID=2620099 RepID=UPI000E8A93D5|nr:NF038130 family PEP-CTERM protein [Roseofilum sp. Belize Diploria]MBP0008694.1 NF038130 family PEP-CTERM protein [Roseofilum sp. Belize Diploria]HBQ97324.1 hypothetical protein [Cyanobacteria bacterium UBA11691]